MAADPTPGPGQPGKTMWRISENPSQNQKNNSNASLSDESGFIFYVKNCTRKLNIFNTYGDYKKMRKRLFDIFSSRLLGLYQVRQVDLLDGNYRNDEFG